MIQVLLHGLLRKQLSANIHVVICMLQMEENGF